MASEDKKPVDAEAADREAARVREESGVTSFNFVEPRKDCPHGKIIEKVTPITQDEARAVLAASCSVCSDKEENWLCLSCNKAFCSRYREGKHMVAHHSEKKDHCMILSLADLEVWCMTCEAYVHTRFSHEAINAIHTVKHGEAPPAASLDKEDDAMLAPREAALALSVSRRVGLVYDERMMKHECMTSNHPEQPLRLSSIYKQLQNDQHAAKCLSIPCPEAKAEDVLRCHTQTYNEYLQTLPDMQQAALNEEARRYNSIYFNKQSVMCAKLSCGGVIAATEEVVANRVQSAVAIVRPPGHHAEPAAAMGFCLYNNVAVAAAVAKERLGVERVLIVDWDVHHGNGTQHMFYDDPNVLYFSAHRYDNGGFYPCSKDAAPEAVGTGAGVGMNVNIGWNERGMGDAEYIAAWQQVLMPIAYEFAPDLVLVSAGFDAAEGDPLGGCSITPDGYAHLTHMLAGLCDGKMVIALEGGYNLTAISRSFSACTNILLGNLPPKMPKTIPKPGALASIRATIAAHRKYWYCLGRTQYEAEQAEAERTTAAALKAMTLDAGAGAGVTIKDEPEAGPIPPRKPAGK